MTQKEVLLVLLMEDRLEQRKGGPPGSLATVVALLAVNYTDDNHQDGWNGEIMKLSSGRGFRITVASVCRPLQMRTVKQLSAGDGPTESSYRSLCPSFHS